MNTDFQRMMRSALRLTRGGQLRAATAAIQAALRGQPGPAMAPSDVQADAHVRAPADADAAIDVEAREVAADPAPPGPSASSAPSREPAAEAFIDGHWGAGLQGRDYKLYIPPQAGSRPLPLVVMLHGCTQHPDDFAAGTRMNEAAREQGFFVLYPAQSQQANPQRCWNWFKHSHQQRGRGEPALIAGMTREVMEHHAIDPARVYVAGLSAGGAMAAILGEAYPELYAAVGVHSGLAAGAARDLPSAMGAMRSGSAPAASEAPGRPTIVFHGDGDATVHPSNGSHVAAASAGAGAEREAQKKGNPGGREATRHLHRDGAGKVLAEHWVVHGAAHAWSGGSSAGSYTDPRGPDATAEMLRFFLEHPRG